MEIKRLTDISSTNDYALSFAVTNEGMEWEGAIMSDFQSDGRGCGTNSWESEPGKNLLFSILIHPTWLEPYGQYLISMVEAVAIYDVLSKYAPDFSIKWPNDIYWRERKISGTLIDGNIKGGKMRDLVIGTGININQRVFLSDAPNPVSLIQITNKSHDPYEILQKILKRFEHYMNIARREWADCQECDTISRLYHKHLFRNDGNFYPYADEEGQFDARIISVHPNGILNLQRKDGTISQYEFKEVKFIIK